ncbi:MAG: hypothetical protein DRP03_00635 [Candidatus Aenigmatarchaeota archaeon]|nr:MAG: hypothetical protein DRP03_00635 [Candidatus Aenigmarchaeota archaeon]
MIFKDEILSIILNPGELYLWDFMPAVFILAIMQFMIITLIDGAVIYQSWKSKWKYYKESWKRAMEKYKSMIAAIFVIWLITTLFSMIPLVGFIIEFILFLAFIFTLQSIIISNNGFYEGISESVRIFRRHPLWVPLSYILILLAYIPFIVVLVLLAVCILFLYGIRIEYFTSPALLVYAVFSTHLALVIYSFGAAVVKTFTLKALTEFYLVFRRKKR